MPAGPPGDEVELGYISGVFGIRGEVRLHLHNRDTELLWAPTDVILESPAGARFCSTCTARSGAGKRVIGRIEGLDQREEAAKLKGWRLHVDVSQLPALGEDEFYVRDVVGLSVLHDGRELGRVQHVHTTPGGEILEVSAPRGPLFLVVHRDLVDIDVGAGVVHVLDETMLEELG